MKNIALFETYWKGHHPIHYRLFTQIFLELGYQVTAFCPQPHEVSEWVANNLPDKLDCIRLFQVEQPNYPRFPIGIIRRCLIALSYWKYARALVEQTLPELDTPPDILFFLHVDQYIAPLLSSKLVDTLFPYNWIGLYHDPFHLRIPPRYASLRKGLLNTDIALYSRHCRAIGVHDEGIANKLQQQLNGKPVIIFPNTIDAAPPDPNFKLVQQIREKAGTRKIIGLLGSLGKRKGLVTLLRVARQCTQKNWFFLLAGEFAPHTFSAKDLEEIQAFVATNPDNCFFQFEHVPGEAQFHALVKTCDVLYVVNENYPSNSQILSLAALFEKPVIANDSFCVGERVKKFNLGIGIPERDISACIQALHQLLGESASDNFFQPDFVSYRELHSVHQLRLACQTILEKSMSDKNNFSSESVNKQ